MTGKEKQMLKCEVDKKKEYCSISVRGSGAEIVSDVLTLIRSVYLYFSKKNSNGTAFRYLLLKMLDQPETWEVTADDINEIIERGVTNE